MCHSISGNIMLFYYHGYCDTEREITESLEQLRWLAYNYPIQCQLIQESPISINTKNDVKKVLKNN